MSFLKIAADWITRQKVGFLLLVRRLIGPLLVLLGYGENLEQYTDEVMDLISQIIGAILAVLLNTDLIRSSGIVLIKTIKGWFKKEK